MVDHVVSGSARLARSSIFGIVAALTASTALAQQPAQPPAPARPAAPAQSRPATPAPAKPAAPAAQQRPATPAPGAQQQPAAPAQGQAQGPQPAPEMPQLIYSPWMKVCEKPEGAPKAICVTFKDGRFENGQPVIMASLIEPEGEPKKILRVFLPPGFQLPYGTRLLVEQADLRGPFLYCLQGACVTEFEATADLISKLKKAPQLVMQAVNLGGYSVSFPLPLNDFAKVNEGPPTDPKVAQEQQKKLQDELQKRAEEARKKLESQPGGAPGAAPTVAAPR